MNLTSSRIADGLRALGLGSGDQVMVHSSLKSLGMVDGGADAVVDAVRSVIGPDGTMLVPTNVFRGSMTEFLRSVDTVDLRTTGSLMGAITEAVRLRPGAVRSIHPSHPVAALGPGAGELLAEHHLGDSPAGARSPYGKLARLASGRILLIGVTNSSNTTFHTAEEYWSPYVFIDERFERTVIGADGAAHIVKVRGYCVGRPRNFTVLDAALAAAGVMTTHTIGTAQVTLLRSRDLLEVLAREIARDPFVLLAWE